MPPNTVIFSSTVGLSNLKVVHQTVSTQSDQQILVGSGGVVQVVQVQEETKSVQTLEALGAIGGNFILFSFLLSLILKPLAEHLFLLSAIEKLFVAKTKYKDLMNWSNLITQKNNLNTADGKFQKNIKFNLSESILLFFYRCLGKSCFCCSKFWKNSIYYTRLYDKCETRMNQNLNVVSLIQNQRQFEHQ